MIPQQLEAELTQRIAAANDSAALEDVRVSVLGKKGTLTELLKAVSTLPPDQRKDYGAAVNQLKERLSAQLDARKIELNAVELNARLVADAVDITLPVRIESVGTIHPISQTIDEITAIFATMGFVVAQAPISKVIFIILPR